MQLNGFAESAIFRHRNRLRPQGNLTGVVYFCEIAASVGSTSLFQDITNATIFAQACATVRRISQILDNWVVSIRLKFNISKLIFLGIMLAENYYRSWKFFLFSACKSAGPE
jgi:hypothetical protein